MSSASGVSPVSWTVLWSTDISCSSDSVPFPRSDLALFSHSHLIVFLSIFPQANLWAVVSKDVFDEDVKSQFPHLNPPSFACAFFLSKVSTEIREGLHQQSCICRMFSRLKWRRPFPQKCTVFVLFLFLFLCSHFQPKISTSKDFRACLWSGEATSGFQRQHSHRWGTYSCSFSGFMWPI